MTLQRKLLTTFLPITLIPLTLAGVVGSIIAYHRAYQQASIQLHDRATLTAELTYYELSGALRLLKIVAAEPLLLELIQAGTTEIEATNLHTRPLEAVETEFAETKLLQPNLYLNNYLKNIANVGHFAEIFVTERHGFNIAYSQITSDFIQWDENWWQQGKHQGTWFDKPQFDQSTNQMTVDLITSINDPKSGEFLGIIKGGYQAQNLQQLKAEIRQIKLSHSEQLKILKMGNQPTEILHIQANQALSNSNSLEATEIMKNAVQVLNNSHLDKNKISTVSWFDQNRLYAMTPIPETDWVVLTTVNQTDVQRIGYQMAAIFALFFMSLSCLSTLAIIKFSRKLSAPIRHLNRLAQQVIYQADFTLQFPVKTHDEVGSLATSFNQLIQWIGEYTKALKQQQSQIIQSEKMSVLGQLSAGIAHEINNPIGSMNSNLTFLEQHLDSLINHLKLYQLKFSDPGDKIIKDAEEIEINYILEDLPELISSLKLAVKQLYNISLSMRIFSRKDTEQAVEFDLNALIDNTLLILSHRLKSTSTEIQVIKNYSKLPFVKGYPSQVNQVFLNILSNAIDAIEEFNLQRSLEDRQAEPSRIDITTETLANDWIKIVISDNGPGIPEEIQHQIFDSFFTTKSLGKGTGLGLSISHQIIVEKHHGKMSCHSTLGKGTEFVIEIPLRTES
jgi:signal transduction histidine kinase